VKKNEQFKVDIHVANASSISRAAFTFVYDPIFVEFVGAAEGPFMKQDGKPTTFQSTVDKGTGQVTVTINRSQDAGSISGTGNLISTTFKAKNQGPSNFGFVGVNLSDVGGKAQETVPYNTVVEVK
jgi:general secretion pathway protein D